MADPCLCDDPPSVANGAVTYTGAYINYTRADYNCDEGYTNSGGSSLICFVSDDTTCDHSWTSDSTDPTSGVPNCEFATGTTVITNNTFEADDNGTELWLLVGLACALLLAVIIAVILLIWWFCCRECCRRCCTRCCPCCRQCCYEIPYHKGANPDHVHSQSGMVMYHGHNHPHHAKQHPGGYEPSYFINSNDDKLKIPQGKPVNSQGQPVWMPHSNNVRTHMKTSTK